MICAPKSILVLLLFALLPGAQNVIENTNTNVHSYFNTMETQLNQLTTQISNRPAVNIQEFNSKLDNFCSDLGVMFTQVVGNMTEAIAERYQFVTPTAPIISE